MNGIYRVAYTAVDSPEGKTRWTRLGVTFRNKDGSETVLLDGAPINGRLVFREPKTDGPES